MIRTLPLALQQHSNKNFIIRHTSIPSRHDAAKWIGTEREWFYCRWEKGSTSSAWRHISNLKFPIIGNFKYVNARYQEIVKTYNIPAFGNRIELYEIPEDFEQEILIQIIKGNI